MKKFIKNDPAVFVLLMVSVLLFALNAAAVMQGGGAPVEKIRRNDYENDARQVTAVMEARLNGQTYRRSVDLTVEPMALTEEEKSRRLDVFEKQLEKRILGENKDPEHIATDLDLFTKDPATGITLLWESSDPSRIDKRGAVYPSPKEGAPVELRAVLELDGMTREWKTTLTHRCVPGEDNLERTLESDLPKVNDALNSDSRRRYATLPKELESGIPVTWKAPADHRLFLAGSMTLLLAFFLYRKKKSDRKNARELRLQEIRRDFPYFLDKLVMLLSAGVILTESVYRIWGDYEKHQQKIRRKILYEELGEAVRAMKNTNAAFAGELLRMSERLQVREFARLAVVLRDSLGSGNDLVTKLENESILMWRERKAAIQTLGRVADTKLIFPLMIILTVLIVIVMTPAVLQL